MPLCGVYIEGSRLTDLGPVQDIIMIDHECKTWLKHYESAPGTFCKVRCSCRDI